MKLVKGLVCGLMLFCTIALYAAEPKAVIEAKPTAQIGEPVWLKTTNSVGKNFYWKVLPDSEATNFTELPIFGGLNDAKEPIVNYWAHYSSLKASPTPIYFVFVATEGDKSDIAIHILQYGPGGPNPPDPIPIPDISPPSTSLKVAIQPVMDMVKGDTTQVKADCTLLKNFYAQLADTVGKDTSITTNEQVRNLNIELGTKTFANTGLKDRYKGLGVKIDEVLAGQLGLEIVTLTDAKRTQIADTFRALAWGFQEIAKTIKVKK